MTPKTIYDQIYQKQNKTIRKNLSTNEAFREAGFAGGMHILHRYGHSNHGREYLNEIEATDKLMRSEGKASGCNVLDIGCGHNEFARALRSKGVIATGIDCSCESADFQIDITERGLPWTDKFFEMVTAFDFLEHLREQDLTRALEEMRRVSNFAYFTIGTQKSMVWYQGHNLHLTVKPMEWWKDQISKAGGIINQLNSRSISVLWK